MATGRRRVLPSPGASYRISIAPRDYYATGRRRCERRDEKGLTDGREKGQRGGRAAGRFSKKQTTRLREKKRQTIASARRGVRDGRNDLVVTRRPNEPDETTETGVGGVTGRARVGIPSEKNCSKDRVC